MKISKVFTMSDPKGIPLVSVCIATHNKAEYLSKTLSSIIELNKDCSFQYEIIVVDDKSTDNTFDVCKEFGVIYARIPENNRKNPSVPRNVSFRLAKGTVIVHQSDEVVHSTYNSIEKLFELVRYDNFVISTVTNVHPHTRDFIELYTGHERQKPFFFLGAVLKKALDLCGGYDEDFISPGYDDDKLASDLIRCGFNPIWTDVVCAEHLDHPKGSMSCGADSAALYYGRKFYNNSGGSNGIYDKIS